MTQGNQIILAKLEQALTTRGVGSFCKVLQSVVKRQGGFSKLSKNTALNRESLYKALSGKRDPRLSTIIETLSALGISLRLEVDKDALEESLHGVSGFEGAWLDMYLMTPVERLERADRAVSDFNELSVIDASD